jgi:formylglycine-generating enzyme required for sulfatase activity/ankyrin repeat protein
MNKKIFLPLALPAFFIVLAAVLLFSLPVQAQVKQEADQIEPRAGEVWKEPVTGMEFVWIPAGKFMMGSNEELADEQPAHRVQIDGFWLGKYEVTQGQWKIVMHDNPAAFTKGDNYPVETVDWGDSQDFITTLSAQSGHHFRLPTEAEWEYACMAGKPRQEYEELGDIAWFNENSNDATHAVGQKKPNAWGLYDMLGNVWEWCQDWYGNYPGAPQTNPSGPESGSSRVIRGGSWSVLFLHVRPVNRGSNLPSDRGDYLGFRLAISKDPSIKTNSKDSATQLVLAVSGGRMDMVEFLIAKGAGINAKNKDGFTALHAAVIADRLEMARLLIAKGAEVNAKDDAFGKTPLHYAADQGPIKMVEFLIAKGADINAKDQFGYTALHEAVIQGPREVVESLIAKGADISVKDNNGYTPLHYAAKRGLKEVAGLLIAKGADVNARDQFGDTPLHVAAQAGLTEMTELLLIMGADVNAIDNKGYSPLRFAEINNQKDVIMLLKKHGAK